MAAVAWLQLHGCSCMAAVAWLQLHGCSYMAVVTWMCGVRAVTVGLAACLATSRCVIAPSYKQAELHQMTLQQAELEHRCAARALETELEVLREERDVLTEENQVLSARGAGRVDSDDSTSGAPAVERGSLHAELEALRVGCEGGHANADARADGTPTRTEGELESDPKLGQLKQARAYLALEAEAEQLKAALEEKGTQHGALCAVCCVLFRCCWKGPCLACGGDTHP